MNAEIDKRTLFPMNALFRGSPLKKATQASDEEVSTSPTGVTDGEGPILTTLCWLELRMSQWKDGADRGCRLNADVVSVVAGGDGYGFADHTHAEIVADRTRDLHLVGIVRRNH